MSNTFKAVLLPLQVFVFLAALCAVLPAAETLEIAERENCKMARGDERLPCVGLEWEGCGNIACPAHQENAVPVVKCLNTSSFCDAVNDCPFFLAVDEGSMAIEFAGVALNPQLECKEHACMHGPSQLLLQIHLLSVLRDLSYSYPIDFPTGRVQPAQFLCPTGGREPIELSKMCDGIAHCPGGDDETNDLCQSE